MLSIKHTLARAGIRSNCCSAAVQDVNEYVMREGEAQAADRANDLLGKVLGAQPIDFSEYENKPVGLLYQYVVAITQAAVEAAMKSDMTHTTEDVALIIDAAKERATKLINNPDKISMYRRPEDRPMAKSGGVAVVKSLSENAEIKVAVTSDGKIKKGGKEQAASQLYQKHVVNSTEPMNNQQFIALLMNELGMTKAGSTTYCYNMRKKFGTPPGMEIKSKKAA